VEELVHDQHVGILVPRNDPQALGAAIAELLVDRGRRLEMGRAARALIEAKFGSAVSLRRTEAVLARCLEDLSAPDMV
jgi:glycosyltransferase involved in cell wall biosynthesis